MGSACSYLYKVGVYERTCECLSTGDENIRQWNFTKKYRGFEKEGNRVDHEREGDLL